MIRNEQRWRFTEMGYVMEHRWRCTECDQVGSWAAGELAARSIERTGAAHAKRHAAKEAVL